MRTPRNTVTLLPKLQELLLIVTKERGGKWRRIKTLFAQQRRQREKSLISSNNNYFSTILNTWKGAINYQPRCPLFHSS